MAVRQQVGARRAGAAGAYTEDTRDALATQQTLPWAVCNSCRLTATRVPHGEEALDVSWSCRLCQDGACDQCCAMSQSATPWPPGLTKMARSGEIGRCWATRGWVSVLAAPRPCPPIPPPRSDVSGSHKFLGRRCVADDNEAVPPSLRPTLSSSNRRSAGQETEGLANDVLTWIMHCVNGA